MHYTTMQPIRFKTFKSFGLTNIPFDYNPLYTKWKGEHWANRVAAFLWIASQKHNMAPSSGIRGSPEVPLGFMRMSTCANMIPFILYVVSIARMFSDRLFSNRLRDMRFIQTRGKSFGRNDNQAAAHIRFPRLRQEQQQHANHHGLGLWVIA